MLNRSGDFLQQIILVDDTDLIVGQLQLHVELRIAGIEHIGNQGQTVHITLANNIEVFMRQLDTFTLCPQSNIGFIEINIGRMDRIFSLLERQIARLLHLLRCKPGLTQLLPGTEQRVDIVGDAYPGIPIGKVFI